MKLENEFEQVILLPNNRLQSKSFVFKNKIIDDVNYLMPSCIDSNGKYRFCYGKYETMKISQVLFAGVTHLIGIILPIEICNMIGDYCSGGNAMNYIDCIFDNFIK